MNENSADRRIMGKWTVSSLAHDFFYFAVGKQNINYLL